MSIAGNMSLYLKPYNNRDFDGTETFAKLKEAVEKLHESTDKFTYEILKISDPGDKPGTSAILIRVPDNVNFWFQLTQLPKLLIPKFWTLPEEILEKKIQQLNANDAWAIENLKKLSLDMKGLISVREEYDSTAEGIYIYSVFPESSTAADVHVIEGRMPDHSTALRQMIETVKKSMETLKKSGEYAGVRVNESAYYGQWK